MKMSALVGFAAVVAMGCGANQSPTQYVASIDDTVYATLPSSCDPTSTNTTKFTETNFNDSLQFEIWNSADGKTTVLSIANFDSYFGLIGFGSNSGEGVPAIGDTLNSTDGKTFTSSIVETNSANADAVTTVTKKVTLTFTDTSYTKGTIAIEGDDSCSGTGCTGFVAITCAPGSANFISQKVSGGNETIYEGANLIQ